jgi:ADP-ribosylglycohydrolase
MIERALRSLRGLSVGDAFGEKLGDIHKTSRQLARRLLPLERPWRWTDDTAMATSIVEVLAARGTIDTDELAAKFAARFSADPARGYGLGAQIILQHVSEGAAWRDESARAFDGHGSAGNGAAMRSAPIGAYFAPDLDRVRVEALRSAEPTHAHPDGAAGAVAVAIAAALATTGEPPSGWLAETIRYTPAGKTRDKIRRAEQLGLAFPEVQLAAEELGTGAMIRSRDTVPFCLWVAARHAGSFEDALWEVVQEAGDRDTLGAIVGGIVACGADVPVLWLEATEPLPLTNP